MICYVYFVHFGYNHCFKICLKIRYLLLPLLKLSHEKVIYLSMANTSNNPFFLLGEILPRHFVLWPHPELLPLLGLCYERAKLFPPKIHVLMS